MIIKSTPLNGAYIIKLKKKNDKRGFFSRIFCSKEFLKKKLEKNFVQFNYSFSKQKHTLRGMHYQIPPFAETKLIKCIKGEIFDVILDLRINSKTFGKSFSTVLSANNKKMIYVPKGFAHGFLTLKKNSEVLYFVTSPYKKTHEKGVRFNDPKFCIHWPNSPKIISNKDLKLPLFNQEWHCIKKLKL